MQKIYAVSKSIFLSLISLSFVLYAAGCKDENRNSVVHVNEEETLTTLTYTLTSADGGDTVVLSFKDTDGTGGDDPKIAGGKLKKNTTYKGSIGLLNESDMLKIENSLEEIEEENNEHQFFFQLYDTTSKNLTNPLDIQIAYTDKGGDYKKYGPATDTLPVGIKTTLKTSGKTGKGILKITLRHQPDKTAPNVFKGDITNAGGETDIAVEFPFTVE